VTPDSDRLRAVYVLDQMQDVRLIEGLAARLDLTVLAPSSLASRITTWPPAGGPIPQAIVPGGRAGFVARGAAWLVRHRASYDVIIAQDELTAAFAANVAGFAARRSVILYLGRLSEEYFRCRRTDGAGGLRYAAGLAAVHGLASFNERSASAISAISYHVEAHVARRARLVRVIPAYGVDTAAYSPSPTREEARRAVDLPTDAQLVLWRSRLAPEKDPDTFLRAMALLRSDGRSATAVYVGGEGEELQRVAARYGIEVVTRPAVHPLRELPLYYRAADVVVQTSKVEGLGLSPLEALACEVPVVASAVGGLTETVRNGETGLSVPVGDAEATADAIAWTLDHPQDAAEMARRGRKMVIERYEAKDAFRQWADLAAEVAGRV
jgi:glycosyltransferase involved in cell wall biosynthesis